MSDIYRTFLTNQYDALQDLSHNSDKVKIVTYRTLPGTSIPTHYLVRYRCRSLTGNGNAVSEIDLEAGVLGLSVPDDYLRVTHSNPVRILTWLDPLDIWHPNVKGAVVCIGPIAPATPLVDLVVRVYEVLTFNRVTTIEHEALNGDACVWARQHMDRFPLESEPLRRVIQPRSEPDSFVIRPLEVR